MSFIYYFPLCPVFYPVQLLYASHYKLQLVYFVPYVSLRLVLQTIYVLNKGILQLLGLKSEVYNHEQFQIKSGL